MLIGLQRGSTAAPTNWAARELNYSAYQWEQQEATAMRKSTRLTRSRQRLNPLYPSQPPEKQKVCLPSKGIPSRKPTAAIQSWFLIHLWKATQSQPQAGRQTSSSNSRSNGVASSPRPVTPSPILASGSLSLFLVTPPTNVHSGSGKSSRSWANSRTPIKRCIYRLPISVGRNGHVHHRSSFIGADHTQKSYMKRDIQKEKHE